VRVIKGREENLTNLFSSNLTFELKHLKLILSSCSIFSANFVRRRYSSANIYAPIIYESNLLEKCSFENTSCKFRRYFAKEQQE